MAIGRMHGGHVGVQNNKIPILWELTTNFMQTFSAVLVHQHGRRAYALYDGRL